ncbi:MAG TPA: protein translocase subunit SecF [Syntrophales bacterium]|nr:protein translocase subunit SecF [Syntrophales bacterium]HOM07884.1 protein translocase subunit SecF [Syntrophales bacterium]HPC01778.1 protein translocase subunit SecF [Syntrophales bacterium]HPQ07375.1 protein translocase subunit SecF [Syntrophales bacterium]HRS87517.1 protein translocase subunit SecF [Syntrophales bacterium]
MEFIKPGTNFDFVGKMKVAFGISMAMIVISIASIVWHGGLNYGIDFAGGTIIQVKFSTPFTIDKIREALRPLGLQGAIIQEYGQGEILIRIAAGASEPTGLSDRVAQSLKGALGEKSVEMRRVEMVGPKVGQDLTRKALLAIFFSWVGMLLYIAWRFEFRFGLGAILALVHDTIITVGAFSILNKEFDLTIVAALLTIIGYSINDTIVVFDRIRENMRKDPKKDLAAVINESVNQTLSRTILTSLTVILVVVVLFFFGGAVIHDFAFALLVGVTVGTYSSIFIASPLVLVWERYRPTGRKRKK